MTQQHRAGRALLGVAGVATLLLAGGCSTDAPTTTRTERRAVFTPAPEPTSTWTSPPAPPAPDVDLSAVRAAPAACGVPTHHLAARSGHVGAVETHLQVEEGYAPGVAPVAPVEADLTGDGGLDLVGVLSCTSNGDALPDHLVLYTDVATPVASVSLASVQKQRLAIVRELQVIGGDVRVEWTAFDSVGGPVSQFVGTVVSRGDSLRIVDVHPGVGPRTVHVDSGSFMSPDGNVRCTMEQEVAWCDVARTTWTPPRPPALPPRTPATPPPAVPTRTPAVPATAATSTDPATSGPSTAPATAAPPSSTTLPSVVPTSGTSAPPDCGSRPYGRTFLLSGGRAKVACAGEQGPETAALGSPSTSWHRGGWDPTVVVDGRRSAALAAGSVMTTGQIRCEAATAAVTCVDPRTQATFTVGRTVMRVSSS